MPSPDYEDEYTQWLSGHVSPETYVIDTIDIYGEPIGYDNTFARWHSTITATTEDAETKVFRPIMFEIQLPEVEASTRQEMRLILPSLEGNVYKRIKQIFSFNKTLPIFLTHRVYISTDFSKPMINPPTTLQVRRVGVSREQIQLQLSVPQWTNRQAGRYYNVENYPGLFNVG